MGLPIFFDPGSELINRALSAATRAELEPLTTDLPEQAAPAPGGGKARRWIVGIMGGGDHRGRWQIASRCTVLNLMGGADLDLTDAIVHGSETEIRVFSLMGGSDIIVPDGVHVELSGFAFMGGNDLRLEDTPPPPPGAPLVRVRAYDHGRHRRQAENYRRLSPAAPPRAPSVVPALADARE